MREFQKTQTTSSCICGVCRLNLNTYNNFLSICLAYIETKSQSIFRPGSLSLVWNAPRASTTNKKKQVYLPLCMMLPLALFYIIFHKICLRPFLFAPTSTSCYADFAQARHPSILDILISDKSKALLGPSYYTGLRIIFCRPLQGMLSSDNRASH